MSSSVSHIDHFSHGFATPALAYVMSVFGSLIGLLMAARARSVEGTSRLWWLTGAAFSIGGTGVWVMHFVAMLGFKVAGTPIRYDVSLTIVSALIAIVAVGGGLVLVSSGGGRAGALVLGGLLAGLGVVGMHYLGMAAMNMSAHASYDPLIVVASVLVAVVAAIAALWFAVRVDGVRATVGAALLMGIAVNAMHYIGMFSLSVEPLATGVLPGGAEAVDFLLPLLVGISLLTIGLLLVLFLSPSSRELREEAELEALIAARRRRNSDWLS